MQPRRKIPPFRTLLGLLLALAAVFSLINLPSLEDGLGFRALLPPLFAITLALLFREVLLALLGGIWLGASYLCSGNPATGLLRTLDTHLINALSDSSHASIILFSLILGGMVGIIGASGGAAGMVQRISRWAKGPRSVQFSAWLMGMLIFFDDYANTLIVGNTFRPLCDRYRISREKLSFIVDATAAPVASIALISTWIGFEVGLIADGMVPLGAISSPNQAYAVFIETLLYRFYPVYLLLLVFLICIRNRDFGSMLAAERRCRATGAVLAPHAKPLTGDLTLDQTRATLTENSWIWGAAPIIVVIVATIVGLYFDGMRVLGEKASQTPMYQIIATANSFNVLMWASFAGALCAGIMGICGARLKLSEVIEAFNNGVKTMIGAIMVLILAWGIGSICQEIKTADYIITTSRGILSPHLIPVLTFIVSALISFATGTSWGTLSILMPIVIPIAYQFPIEANLGAEMSRAILITTIGSVLAGSTFGDHASPISDTTIISSMASGADHLDHVKTQLPYALVAALVALIFGYLPAGFNVSPLIILPVGV
ncbi:MAG: Na+/H+ antiporter NhaC family protein, partial [bacterium]